MGHLIIAKRLVITIDKLPGALNKSFRKVKSTIPEGKLAGLAFNT